MTAAVHRAAQIANRAALDAKERISLLRARAAARLATPESLVDTVKWLLDEIEQELAGAFTAGFCANAEETPAGRLPAPRRRRVK